MFIIVKGNKPKTFHPLRDKPNKYAGSVIHGTRRKQNGDMFRCSSSGKEISEFGYRYNVWHQDNHIVGSEYTGHPAPFPLDLAKDHIRSWSEEGDIVLDPFMGSGTTAKACIALNRKYIGFEIDEEYWKMSQKRIREVQMNLF